MGKKSPNLIEQSGSARRQFTNVKTAGTDTKSNFSIRFSRQFSSVHSAGPSLNSSKEGPPRKILVPVRYPPIDANKRSIQWGFDLVAGHENPELLVFYMNEVQSDQRINRETLRDAVESAFEGIDESSVIRSGFFVEAAIIEEAIRLGRDYFILSEYRRDRWKRLLEEIFDLEIVTDTGSDSENT